MRRIVARYPLLAFYVLACLWTWPLAAGISVSLLLPLLALFGPAVAALAVAGVTEGRAGVRALVGRLFRWRVHPAWYAVAVGLPLLLTLAAIGVNRALGVPTPPGVGDFSAISIALAVLIVGEEVGWRGYALPKLLERRSGLVSALIVGALWGLWHLPNFLLPGFPHAGRSLPAFLLATVSYSVLFTWIFRHTGGSVLLACLFHAAINLFSPTGIAPERQEWIEVLVYGAAALGVALALGRSLAAPGARSGEPARGRVEVAR